MSDFGDQVPCEAACRAAAGILFHLWLDRQADKASNDRDLPRCPRPPAQSPAGTLDDAIPF